MMTTLPRKQKKRTRAGRHDLSPTQKVSKLRFQGDRIAEEALLFMADDQAPNMPRIVCQTRYAHLAKSSRGQILVLVTGRQEIDKTSLRGNIGGGLGPMFQIRIGDILVRDIRLYAPVSWQLLLAEDGYFPAWDEQGKERMPVEIPSNCWVEETEDGYLVCDYKRHPPHEISEANREAIVMGKKEPTPAETKVLYISYNTKLGLQGKKTGGRKRRSWLTGHETRPYPGYVPILVRGELVPCEGKPGVCKFQIKNILSLDPENQPARQPDQQPVPQPSQQTKLLYISAGAKTKIASLPPGGKTMISGTTENRRDLCPVMVKSEGLTELTQSESGFNPLHKQYRFSSSAIVDVSVTQSPLTSDVQEIHATKIEPPASAPQMVEKATGEKAELILPKDSTTEAGTGVKPVYNHPPSDDGDGEWNGMVARLLEIVSKNANTQQPLKITVRETRGGVVREMIMEPITEQKE